MSSFLLKTWNCFGTAQSALAALRWRGAPDAHRFAHPEVARAVREADVLCLQELFISDAEEFFERLDHTHKARVGNRSTVFPLTFGGSGLGVASRFPLLCHATRSFSRPHVGAERFARKGVLHARIDLGGPVVDVFTTHMQSGEGLSARDVRLRQLRELAGWVEELGAPERTAIVCGDLNIDGLSPARARGEYDALRGALPDFWDLGAEHDRPTFHPDPEVNELAHRFNAKSPRQRIDYVLFRPSRQRDVQPGPCELALERPVYDNGRRTFASDHFALRARFDWRTGPERG